MSKYFLLSKYSMVATLLRMRLSSESWMEDFILARDRLSICALRRDEYNNRHELVPLSYAPCYKAYKGKDLT